MKLFRWSVPYILVAIFLLGAAMMISAHPGEETSRMQQLRNLNVSIDKIVVSLEDFELLAFSNGRLISRYPVSIGADTGPTPTGEFKVINKLKDPWYTPPHKPAKAPGPENPLGSRWMGIDKPSYGIHGTKDPASIGTAASEGCIRLYNQHVEVLFEQVQKGTKVIIRESISDNLKRLTALVDPPEPDKETQT